MWVYLCTSLSSHRAVPVMDEDEDAGKKKRMRKRRKREIQASKHDPHKKRQRL